jgi:hypothetical protein
MSLAEVLNNVVIVIGIVLAAQPFKAQWSLHVPQGLKLNKSVDVLYVHNVTSRRVRATFVPVGKQYILHILSLCL